MSELNDRLEALANRGTHRGVDDVLNAARRDAEAPAAEHSSDDDDLPIVDDHLPFVTPEPGARRRRFGSFVAAAGIAALVGVGALAITAMFGSGGAGSPEGAVRQLADAISHKDPLAAVDVLVPSEVRSLRDSVHAVTQRAADLKIVNEASQPLAGVDLSVDHLQLTTEPLADGYAKVVVTSGEISANTHRNQMSALLQHAWRGGDPEAQTRTDLTKLAASSDLPTFVVAVRRDGRWYVSPAYTALEYAREMDGGPAAAFGSAHAAELGAASPEAAVSDALHAWQAGNWDRLMALAPPDELPVYDYRAWIAQAAADTHPDFTIDHLSTSATVNGDSATVKLDASGTMNSDPVQNWQVGGTCPEPTYGDTLYESDGTLSSGTGPSPGGREMGLCLAGDLGQVAPLGLMRIGASTDPSSIGPVSIEVVRENGRWFVSPVTTLLDAVDATIAHVDQRTAYTWLGLAYELPPDGTITLDQPFDVAASPARYSSYVYAFEGRAGQKIVGQVNSPARNGLNSAYGTLYNADGDQVGEVDFESVPTNPEYHPYFTTIELPASGSYRLVMQPYGPSTNLSLTLWDLAHAPKQIRDTAQENTSHCTSSGGLFGTETCFSQGTGLLPETPTTFVIGSSGSSGSNSSSGGYVEVPTTGKSATATSSSLP